MGTVLSMSRLVSTIDHLRPESVCGALASRELTLERVVMNLQLVAGSINLLPSF